MREVLAPGPYPAVEDGAAGTLADLLQARIWPIPDTCATAGKSRAGASIRPGKPPDATGRPQPLRMDWRVAGVAVMIRLALLRHGHTVLEPREGRIQGRTDIPLDAEAIAVLSRLALPDGLGKRGPCRQPAFPRPPYRRTGRRAYAHEPSPALTEMNWGDWEGCAGGRASCRPPQRTTARLTRWGWDYLPPPGGESLADRARTSGTLGQIA